jgi:NodT family efflux transporter outer membrane factor (OMF) lipoprotein
MSRRSGLIPAVRRSLAVAATGLLAGCVVGPNYRGPPVAAPHAAAAGAFRRGGEIAKSQPPAARWWTALGDAELDHLIEAALAANPDVEAAEARLRQSRAILRQDKANALPTSSASAVGLRGQGLTGALGGGGGQTLTIYNTGFDATWELDLFGGNRRTVEGARADAEARQADLEGARVSLAADVAQAYVNLRDYQARLAMSRHNAEIEGRMLELTRRRRDGGTASDLDVERLNTQLESTRADLQPLGAQITGQLDRLAVLTAREPGDLDAELAPVVAPPFPPATVAVGDPAELLRRRPDVRAAERNLARQTAIIGQRTADLFPKVTLLGDIGFTSSSLSQLLTSGSFTSIAAPILQWSPLDFGRNQARIGQARATRDEALANYRKTVLSALEDAETGLDRYGRQRAAVVSLARVKASADRVASLTDLKMQGGTASTLDILDAEQRRVQADNGLEEAQALLTEDYVALQKSLGLGWRE